MSVKQHKINGNIKFFLLSAFIVIITFIVCGGAQIYKYLKGFSSGNLIKPQYVSDSNSPVNILLMGLDIGSDKNNDDKSKRTDTLMLINYKPKEEKVNLVSIPRDTLIQVNGKDEKINAANVLGGVPLTIEAVEKLLNIKINYYGKVNYEGFRKIIDIIGGVDMKITRNMNYDDESQNLHIHFTKGSTVHLDGQKSEEFFRWRKNNNGTGLAMGDIDRIANQHLFINKVIDKFKNPSILTKLPEIMSVLPNYIESNLQTNDFIKYGIAVSKINKESVKLETIQGDVEDIDGVSYFIYDEKKSNNVIALIK